MEWFMRDSTSHRERSIAICTLGSGVGSRVASSLGRSGVSSLRRSSSNLRGNRDIDGQCGRKCRIAQPQLFSLYHLPCIPVTVRHLLDKAGLSLWPGFKEKERKWKRLATWVRCVTTGKYNCSSLLQCQAPTHRSSH